MGNFLAGNWPMISLIVFMVGMLFFSSRKEKKRQEERKNLQNNLEVGDSVLMECGIVGKVVSTKDLETIVIETGADKTKLRFKRWAIASKIEE